MKESRTTLLASLSMFALLFLAIGSVGVIALQTKEKADTGRALAAQTERYSRWIGEDRPNVLVFGDSLAYGVGASNPETSFAGLAGAHHEGSNILNRAQVGESTNSLLRNLEQFLGTKRYDHTYIIIGGNDVIRLGIDIEQTSDNLQQILNKTAAQSGKVTLITTGDFQNVTILPEPLRPIFSDRSEALHQAAKAHSMSHANVDYIDVFDLPAELHASYEAADGLHFNDSGVNELFERTLAE